MTRDSRETQCRRVLDDPRGARRVRASRAEGATDSRWSRDPVRTGRMPQETDMQEDSPLTHSVTTSRRGLLALAVGGALATAIATPRAFAQARAVELPKASDTVEPFSVSVPKSAIDDLKRRLESTRWPDRETVSDWSQGVPLEKAKGLIAYWRDRYDVRKFEARVNAFPQYRTRIDGLGIPFIHVRSPNPNALPIILTHGWPGSFVEFME